MYIDQRSPIVHIAQWTRALQNLDGQKMDKVVTTRRKALTTRSGQNYDKLLTTRSAKLVQNADYTKFRIVTEADDYAKFNTHTFTENILA